MLALVVERARGLVQNEDARVAQEHARDGDALLLTAGQPRAALAHERVVAVGQRADELVDVGLARRFLDFGLGGAGAAVGDVLPTVPPNKYTSCCTMPMASRKLANCTPRTSTPSMVTAPAATS